MAYPQLNTIEIPTKQAKPFLKWAGGKTQLLSQFEDLYPLELSQEKIVRYIEPFIGGGAVFFEIAQKYKMTSAYLYDINPELILAYKVVQKDPGRLIEQLGDISEHYKSLNESNRKAFYYETREKYNLQRSKINYQRYSDNWILRTTTLIFLNRTCFNGLFRLNSKGGFNVPYGRYKTPRILDEENLLAVSQLLQIAEIEVADFEICENAITPISFVYFDPPYRPLSRTASFTSYSTFNFDDSQQTRLANFFRHLDRCYDVKMMLSNSNPKNEIPEDMFFDELYEGFNTHHVYANRMINSNAKKRGQISELVITNYKTSITGKISTNGKNRS
jgi:DNA adenine methylase